MRDRIKTSVILCLLIGMAIPVRSQITVFDRKLVEAIAANHIATMSQLSPIQSNLEEVSATRKIIAEKIIAIQLLKQKYYEHMEIVADTIRDGKNIRHAYDIVQDIGKYQQEMVAYAQDNPALLVIAFDNEAALVSRSADLLTYIFDVAIKGGDENLMTGKQRIELIRHIIHELRIIRGIAYGVLRKMSIAARTGVLNSLNPYHLNYPDKDEFLVGKILEDF